MFHENRDGVQGNPCASPAIWEAGPYMGSKSPERLEEDNLVRAAQTGDSDALAELLTRNRDSLYRVARRFTLNGHEAEDLVQDTMLRAIRKFDTFRGHSKFSTWLISIVTNSALSAKRRGKNLHWISLDESAATPDGPRVREFPDHREDPEQEFARQELIGILGSMLQRQSAKDQVILRRYALDEEPIEDVAKALGLSPSSAKSRIYRARRRLTRSFRSRGIAERRSPAALLALKSPSPKERVCLTT